MVPRSLEIDVCSEEKKNSPKIIIKKASSLLLANGTLENAAWGAVWDRKACPAVAGRYGQRRGGRQLGSGRPRQILPRFPELQKILSSALWQQQAMPRGRGRQQGTGHPRVLPCTGEAAAGKTEGLKLQLRERPLRPRSLQLLQDRCQLQLPEQLLSSPDFASGRGRHGGAIQAARSIWLSTGHGEGEKGAIPFQVR